jgi:hypothetical protein
MITMVAVGKIILGIFFLALIIILVVAILAGIVCAIDFWNRFLMPRIEKFSALEIMLKTAKVIGGIIYGILIFTVACVLGYRLGDWLWQLN